MKFLKGYFGTGENVRIGAVFKCFIVNIGAIGLYLTSHSCSGSVCTLVLIPVNPR